MNTCDWSPRFTQRVPSGSPSKRESLDGRYAAKNGSLCRVKRRNHQMGLDGCYDSPGWLYTARVFEQPKLLGNRPTVTDERSLCRVICLASPTFRSGVGQASRRLQIEGDLGKMPYINNYGSLASK